MKHISHFNTAVLILQHYQGQEPFAHFIRNFFRQNKKFGSSDRKEISHLCYCSFRTGCWLKKIGLEDRILAGIFLCDNASNEIVNYFKPSWSENISLSIVKKLDFIFDSFKDAYPDLLPGAGEIFPWKNELSAGVDFQAFSSSFLQQPDLFIRIRPGFEKTVRIKLLAAEIHFKEISSDCLAFDNSTSLDKVIVLNKEAVIQDMNSQNAGKMLTINPDLTETDHLRCWDCCAGSGGKSIMLHDMKRPVDLTVSDIRGSVLSNLRKRFEEAGISNYKSFVADLTSTRLPLSFQPDSFDLIIADLPCSGSGTWARTPEALYFYDKKKTGQFSSLQKKIVSNSIPYLKKDGALVYITCSVFRRENEEVVDYIRQKFRLRLEKMQLFPGYDHQADTMFAARFIA
ncbi:MAG TPA: methyltransferase domain-containing protein [Puia sp.]|nr:methyltransferase domain-containing protein [Puia sp.]